MHQFLPFQLLSWSLFGDRFMALLLCCQPRPVRCLYWCMPRGYQCGVRKGRACVPSLINISINRFSYTQTPRRSRHYRCLQPSYGDDFVPRLKKAALDKGLTFVGPDLAAKVAKGDMEDFTKLVQATREALQEE